jgi:hypothetical protein
MAESLPQPRKLSGFTRGLVERQKIAEAVVARSDVVNTQLKQGVNERVSRRLTISKLSFRLEALQTLASLRACRVSERRG